MNPTTPIIIPLQNTITPLFTHKRSENYEKQNYFNKEEKENLFNT